jgi:hypothetical protein
MNRGILALVPPNPHGELKERSHEALGFFKTIAENRGTMIICHESEEVYTSDFNIA